MNFWQWVREEIQWYEIGFLIILVLVFILPFGCWQISDVDDANNLLMWTFGGLDEMSLMQKVVDEYQFAHPGVRIKLDSVTDRVTEKYVSGMEAGKCADLLYMHYSFISSYAPKGELEPLDEYIKRDNYDFSDYFPFAVEAYRYDGTMYALPLLGCTMALYYNIDMFDKAGLEYPNEEWTWDDFLEAAKKLTIIEDGRLIQAGCSPYSPHTWMWSAGGKYANEDFTELYFNDPATVAGLQFYHDLRNVHKVTPSLRYYKGGAEDPTKINVFENNRIAMEIAGAWKLWKYKKYSEVRDFRWDVSYFPIGPAGRQTRYAGEGFSIWSGSQKKELAWDFLKFLSSARSQQILAENLVDLPTRRSVAYSPIFLDREKYNWDMQVFAKSQEPEYATIKFYPKHALWPAIEVWFIEEFEGALMGTQTVQEALDRVQKKGMDYLREETARKIEKN